MFVTEDIRQLLVRRECARQQCASNSELTRQLDDAFTRWRVLGGRRPEDDVETIVAYEAAINQNIPISGRIDAVDEWIDWQASVVKSMREEAKSAYNDGALDGW